CTSRRRSRAVYRCTLPPSEGLHRCRAHEATLPPTMADHSPSSAQYVPCPTCFHLLEHLSRLPGRPQAKHSPGPPPGASLPCAALPQEPRKPRVISCEPRKNDQFDRFLLLTE
ncbi:unnamed protein product, partial [Ectocarpus sp. 6 AP-2014]